MKVLRISQKQLEKYSGVKQQTISWILVNGKQKSKYVPKIIFGLQKYATSILANSGEKKKTWKKLAESNLFWDKIIKKEKRIKREFIKSFLECLSLRDKIICMALKDSGLDSGDLLNLTLKVVRYQDSDSEIIFIRSQRNKKNYESSENISKTT